MNFGQFRQQGAGRMGTRLPTWSTLRARMQRTRPQQSAAWHGTAQHSTALLPLPPGTASSARGTPACVQGGCCALARAPARPRCLCRAGTGQTASNLRFHLAEQQAELLVAHHQWRNLAGCPLQQHPRLCRGAISRAQAELRESAADRSLQQRVSAAGTPLHHGANSASGLTRTGWAPRAAVTAARRHTTVGAPFPGARCGPPGGWQLRWRPRQSGGARWAPSCSVCPSGTGSRAGCELLEHRCCAGRPSRSWRR